MIRSIHIKNFQSHADTTLELAPTVTVITGASDQGKTAILRALKKVLRNDPTGDFFIRWGQKACEISIDVDGVEISRRVGRGNSRNVYMVGDTKFENFGTNVPEEVKLAMHIADPQEFERYTLDLNIRTQHEGLFLVGGSGVESLRGRIFAKITGSDKINKAIKTLNGSIRNCTSSRDAAISEIEAHDCEIASMDYLANVGNRLGQAKTILDKIQKLQQRLLTLQRIQSELALTRQAGIAESKKLQRLHQVDCQAISDKCKKVEILTILNKTILEIEPKLAKFERVSQLFVKFDGERLKNMAERLLTLRSIQRKRAELEGQIDMLLPVTEISTDFHYDACAAMVNWLSTVRALRDKLAETRAAGMAENANSAVLFEQLIAANTEQELLKKTIGVCPLCDRPFE